MNLDTDVRHVGLFLEDLHHLWRPETYSAAVCELSDRCDILSVRGLVRATDASAASSATEGRGAEESIANRPLVEMPDPNSFPVMDVGAGLTRPMVVNSAFEQVLELL
jgi:hypothetical protein